VWERGMGIYMFEKKMLAGLVKINEEMLAPNDRSWIVL
jgi:hypothetical protein